jgi:alkylation response protein AidB-like acyl-CoA dehydrogenase
MTAKHVLERETFGKKLSDRQSVQFMLADCAAEIYKARLMLLHIAYKAENGLDMTQENSIAKIFSREHGSSGSGYGASASWVLGVFEGYAVGGLVHIDSQSTTGGWPR